MTNWLPTLKIRTQVGYDLSVKMARVAVKMTQPDAEVRAKLRSVCSKDVAALIASSQVVATYFACLTEANDYWRAPDVND
ncbi:MAG TPA: hexameric tyrosine-coordinated heme protein [Amaricoccus sp.]|uniref:hexameric tyrosine-coordinated heme protein n=1 Tax=Amaricoccus sp. TaxID=1872485 RepID=UPI002CFBBC8B|nr:hexameric tyrosine-coordinated heme protein [Amaricoccus sp.]HMQ91663.1 hexameric tyrosine-coordinated heme protein [Amaricoccus sp.]HMR52234.1 hexameric tyrosine-coordinated heme protein [Amaricoccus sp.]HMT99086.1 hexameric tyrosine-coordinated heme protein [Amaricoccus sp.]